MIEKLFAKRNNLPIVFQAENSECALACIAMVSGYHGRNIDINSLRKRQQVSSVGATVKDIISIASSLSMRSRPLKLELEELKELQLPAILHWNMDDFVVLKKVGRNSIVVHDPAVGRRIYPLKEVGKHFTGIAVELFPGKEFVKTDERQINKITDFFTTSGSFYRCVIQIFVLSMFAQVIALITPFYVQLTVDQGLARRDPDFILAIAIAFTIIAVAKASLTYLRGMIVIYFSNQLGFQMVNNIFHHLIRLPVEFFERRHMGDVVSRFNSANSIKQMVTQDMITVVVDGVFSVTTLILLYIYSPLLATIALVFLVIYLIVRFCLMPFEKIRRNELLVADASQQSSFMENMRSIMVTKMYCNEQQRAQLWQNNYAETINRGVHLGRFQLGEGSFRTLLFGLDHVAIIFFGSTLVVQQQLTIGQLMAFIFLKQHFAGSIASMIPKLIEMKLIRLQLERLADITFTDTEFDDFELSKLKPRIKGHITASRLSYCFPGLEKKVIDDLDFQIKPGHFTAITGPSGCGKSTLLKLLTGVLTPTSGSIVIDGIDFREYGLREYRSQISAVMHSDTLLSGSIQYNIVMDHDAEDPNRLEWVTKLVQIHDDITALPMGFRTNLGDMGVSLSAGQVQRILLARAIYKNPKILFLDEAMANLGNELSKTITKTLLEADISIVMVTHNPALVGLASEVIELGQKIHVPGLVPQPVPA